MYLISSSKHINQNIARDMKRNSQSHNYTERLLHLYTEHKEAHTQINKGFRKVEQCNYQF